MRNRAQRTPALWGTKTPARLWCNPQSHWGNNHMAAPHLCTVQTPQNDHQGHRQHFPSVANLIPVEPYLSETSSVRGRGLQLHVARHTYFTANPHCCISVSTTKRDDDHICAKRQLCNTQKPLEPVRPVVQLNHSLKPTPLKSGRAPPVMQRGFWRTKISRC
jgi:hypothetical protein